MKVPRLLLASLLLLGLGAPTALHAQEEREAATTPAPLEDFVRQVARLWSSGEVAALVEMMPEDNGFTLDTGAGIETANARHAAAALRALFDRSETLEADPVRVTVASSEPPSGFGEINWTFRARGAPGQQSRSIYVGARWGGRNWRITELRVMP